MKYILAAILLISTVGCSNQQPQPQGRKFVVRQAMKLELILDGQPCSLLVSPGDEIIILSEFKKVGQEKDKIVAQK